MSESSDRVISPVEQVFAAVLSLRGSLMFTLEVALATARLLKTLSSYGGGCHILVGQKGLLVLSECVKVHREDPQLADLSCSVVSALGRSEVPGALREFQLCDPLQELISSRALDSNSQISESGLQALSLLIKQGFGQCLSGMENVIKSLGAKLDGEGALASAASSVLLELGISGGFSEQVEKSGLGPSAQWLVSNCARADAAETDLIVLPQSLLVERERVMAASQEEFEVWEEAPTRPRLRSKSRSPSVVGSPRDTASALASPPRPLRSQKDVSPVPQKVLEADGVSEVQRAQAVLEAGEMVEDTAPVDELCDVWSDDEDFPEEWADFLPPRMVTPELGRTAQAPGCQESGLSCQPDQLQVAQAPPRTEFWPAVEHLVWLQDSSCVEPLGESGIKQEASKRLAEVNRQSRDQLGDARGTVLHRLVYQRVSRLYCAEAEPHPDVKAGPDTLHFDSHFESGNLGSATQIFEYEYDLRCDEDYNTSGHTQWYYFSVANMEPGREYRFSITNFEKSASQYNDGMLPLLYSTQAAEQCGQGWCRSGHNVSWYKSEAIRKCGRPYYILSFSIILSKYEGDLVYLAYGVPYTLHDLHLDLEEAKQLVSVQGPDVYFEQSVLCESMAGVPLEMVTVWDGGPGTKPFKDRPVAVISSRVHPGESNSSWMMRGVLFFLCSGNPIAVRLRQQLRIILIPILNPDGVALGNYRCSMAGLDLNRQYRHPSREVTPCIYWYKALLLSLSKSSELAFVCDLHGHSRKFDSFMYGCKNKTHKRERVLPILMSRRTPNFKYKKCSFSVQKSKAGTGRVVGWKSAGVMACYTYEASFAGSSTAQTHYRTGDWENLGVALCEALSDWLDVRGVDAKIAEILASVKKTKRSAGGSSTLDAASETADSDESGDSDSDGSDDDPCSGNLPMEALKARWKKHLGPTAASVNKRRTKVARSPTTKCLEGTAEDSTRTLRSMHSPERVAKAWSAHAAQGGSKVSARFKPRRTITAHPVEAKLTTFRSKEVDGPESSQRGMRRFTGNQDHHDFIPDPNLHKMPRSVSSSELDERSARLYSPKLPTRTPDTGRWHRLGNLHLADGSSLHHLYDQPQSPILVAGSTITGSMQSGRDYGGFSSLFRSAHCVNEIFPEEHVERQSWNAARQVRGYTPQQVKLSPSSYQDPQLQLLTPNGGPCTRSLQQHRPSTNESSTAAPDSSRGQSVTEVREEHLRAQSRVGSIRGGALRTGTSAPVMRVSFRHAMFQRDERAPKMTDQIYGRSLGTAVRSASVMDRRTATRSAARYTPQHDARRRGNRLPSVVTNPL